MLKDVFSVHFNIVKVTLFECDNLFSTVWCYKHGVLYFIMTFSLRYYRFFLMFRAMLRISRVHCHMSGKFFVKSSLNKK